MSLIRAINVCCLVKQVIDAFILKDELNVWYGLVDATVTLAYAAFPTTVYKRNGGCL